MDPALPAIDEAELLENLAWVQALARRLVTDPARADDVAQEVCLNALERPPRRVSGATLRAWLASVTRTVARQTFRTETLRRRRELAAARREALPATWSLVERAALQKRVIEAVLALEEPERTTVLLHHEGGLDAPAIATLRSETAAAVRKRLSRAHARLRARLERELDDEGRSWIHALAPLAFGGGRQVARAALGPVIGGALMSKASWMTGVAAAAVAVLLGGWYVLREARPPEREAPTGVETAALPGVEARPGGDEGAAKPELPADVAGEPARVALAEEAAPPAGPVYLLSDPDGIPVAHAELLLCRDGAALARGETDAEGCFAPELEEDGEAKLLAVVTGWPPQIFDVPLEPGMHEVALRAGEVLSGWIVVDGGPPAERMKLILVGDEPLFEFEEALGAPAESFGVTPTLWISLRARAGEEGSFYFAGLPRGWSGKLWVPADYRVLDTTRIPDEYSPWMMHLERAEENLRVEVTKELALKGRIVDLREGEYVPLEDVNVQARLVYSSPPDGAGFTYTDADGEFRFRLREPSVQRGHLFIVTLDNTLSRTVELEPREAREDWDLGDIPLVDPETTRVVRLLVRAPDGSPISGAVAGIGLLLPISEPTDAEGRAELRGVAPGHTTIVVYAVGYEVEKVEVPEPAPEELVVELEKGVGLELHFTDASGEPAKGLLATFLAARHPIREGAARPISKRALLSAGCGDYHWTEAKDGSGTLDTHLDDEGRLVLGDVEPGLPLHLSVTARSGRVLDERNLAPLAPAEWRRLDVELAQNLRSFHGRVLDETGSPIPSARITRDWFPAEKREIEGVPHQRTTEVDSDGRFTLDDLYASKVSLLVRARGYAPLFLEDHPLPEDDSVIELRLAAGHDVTVHVEDRDGHPMPARAYVWLNADGETKERPFEMDFGAANREVGTYFLRDLPAKYVTICVRTHGVAYWRAHDPLVPELTIEVPVLGALEATIAGVAGLDLDQWSCLWLFPRGGAGLVRRYAVVDRSGRSPVHLPDVLPGDYDAVVRRWHRPDVVPPDLRFEDFPDGQFDELTQRVPVTVREGETTRVEL